jgi:SAM-dependent methyltransferase
VREGKLELRCAGAEALPYPPGYFTKACSVNSIFYWQNAARAIAELWRVLAEGGTLVLCFTCKQSLGARAFARHGLALYEGNEVQGMMEAGGFQQVGLLRAADQHRAFMCAVGRK